ncbi:hypothetical protein ABWI00_21710 [Algihabitans albus]|uniref:hyaluronate lyase N-terminal domain-containing protein n=1 Tax=Algihabitans albus TaxID=2164067 RepID=UPI0035D0B03F
MSTQLRLRRDTATDLAATTPAAAEPGYDQTNKRLIVGDGVTAGGVPHGSFADIQAQRFTFAEAILTGTTYNVTLTPPLPAYAPGVGLLIRPNATNPGLSNINVNARGLRALRKLSVGSMDNLSPGDLVAGRLYPIAYDGEFFQLVGPASGISAGSVGTNELANGAVTTAKIAGSAVRTGSIAWSSGVLGGSTGSYILPGGSFGLYPRTSSSGQNTGVRILTGPELVEATWISFVGGSTLARQAYVQSSPPYDFGDGEIAGTIFLAVNSAGTVLGSYVADAPPWINNGPHDPRPHFLSAAGRKFRLGAPRRRILAALQAGEIDTVTADARLRAAIADEPDDVGRLRRGEISIDALLAGSAGEEIAASHLVEIDQAYKNADMPLLPHPFGGLPAGATVLLLDPLCDLVCGLIEAQGEGENICDLLHRGVIRPDNEALEGRHGPAGVRQVRVRI